MMPTLFHLQIVYWGGQRKYKAIIYRYKEEKVKQAQLSKDSHHGTQRMDVGREFRQREKKPNFLRFRILPSLKIIT